MMEEKTCGSCRFYVSDFVCGIPLYVDAEFYPGRETEPEGGCHLWEAREPEKKD